MKIRQSTQFRRDVKRLDPQGLELSELKAVIEILAAKQPLSVGYRDHSLSGNWRGYRECHIQPDWLLIHKMTDEELQLLRTGSHAELFGK